jgi:protein-tyrosine phosphatase
MPEQRAVIDLHSHLLPGVDDGSRSVEQSLRVLGRFAESGITDVCLTPHLLASQASAGVPDAQDRAFERLSAAAGDAVRLHRGAEVMLDRPLPPRAAENSAIRLGGTRYILVEFPRLVTAETVEAALRHVAGLGLRAVLAHPERYSSCSVGAAQRWKATGAVLQLDATTLLASQARGERARALLAAGLGDIVAGDNHGDDRSLRPIRDALTSQGAAEQADILSGQNPRAILEDRALLPVEPATLKLSFGSRIRRLFDSADG